MNVAAKESSAVPRMNGWPLHAKFAFRNKEGELVYYTTNPRTNNATRINDGINRPEFPR